MRKISILFAFVIFISLFNSCFDNKEFYLRTEISVISREDGSGTRGAFVSIFGIEQENEFGETIDRTTQEAQITNNTAVMLSSVSRNPYAIGYVSLGGLNDTVKVLKIDSASISAENIKNGEYKIYRAFNIVTKGETSEVVKDFIGYIFSPSGQAVISNAGYVEVDSIEYKSSNPMGVITIAGSSSVAPAMEKLREAYLSLNNNASIEIQQSDSTMGIYSVQQEICDIGMSSRELKESEIAQGLTSIPIALDGLAVIVNKLNPLDELNSDEVREIFSGNTTFWNSIIQEHEDNI